MTSFRSKASAFAGAFLVAAAVAPPALAHADPGAVSADAYGATAEASALDISLFGQQVTIGAATASVTSPDHAEASGSGALVVTQSFGDSAATATGVGSSDGSTEMSCSPFALPAQVPLLDVSAACSSSIASVTEVGPTATATGQAVRIELGGDPLLAPIVEQLPIETITTTLLNGLEPLLGAIIPVPTEMVADEVTQLLENALTGNGVAILTVEAGNSEAHTEVTEDSVIATSTSTGLVIKVIDRGGESFGTQAILTIEVGEATTSVIRDRATGETTTEYTATPARVSVADDIALLLSLPASSFEVPSGQRIDLPLPAPLQSSVTVASGVAQDLPSGAGAQAGSVHLNLIQGLNGGVEVGLGAGSAAVEGDVAPAPTPTTAPPADTPAPTPPPKAAAPAPRTNLPRTGIEDSRRNTLVFTLIGLAVVIGGTAAVSSRRSRTEA